MLIKPKSCRWYRLFSTNPHPLNSINKWYISDQNNFKDYYIQYNCIYFCDRKRTKKTRGLNTQWCTKHVQPTSRCHFRMRRKKVLPSSFGCSSILWPLECVLQKHRPKAWNWYRRSTSSPVDASFQKGAPKSTVSFLFLSLFR